MSAPNGSMSSQSGGWLGPPIVGRHKLMVVGRGCGGGVCTYHQGLTIGRVPWLWGGVYSVYHGINRGEGGIRGGNGSGHDGEG